MKNIRYLCAEAIYFHLKIQVQVSFMQSFSIFFSHKLDAPGKYDSSTTQPKTYHVRSN